MPFEVVYTKVLSFTIDLTAFPIFKSSAVVTTAIEIQNTFQEVK